MQARNSSGLIAAEHICTDDGQLHTANCGGTTTLTNRWDAMDNRVRLDVNGTTYLFTYDVHAAVPAVSQHSCGDRTLLVVALF